MIGPVPVTSNGDFFIKSFVSYTYITVVLDSEVQVQTHLVPEALSSSMKGDFF
jgi:hypothetical protein